jgi:hypothetical protein
MSCFLCGEEITRNESTFRNPKKELGNLKIYIAAAAERTIWIVSVDATHTRAESAEGKGETMVGAKMIAISVEPHRNTIAKHAETSAA